MNVSFIPFQNKRKQMRQNNQSMRGKKTVSNLVTLLLLRLKIFYRKALDKIINMNDDKKI
jgi:hypothetical protein